MQFSSHQCEIMNKYLDAKCAFNYRILSLVYGTGNLLIHDFVADRSYKCTQNSKSIKNLLN